MSAANSEDATWCFIKSQFACRNDFISLQALTFMSDGIDPPPWIRHRSAIATLIGDAKHQEGGSKDSMSYRIGHSQELFSGTRSGQAWQQDYICSQLRMNLSTCPVLRGDQVCPSSEDELINVPVLMGEQPADFKNVFAMGKVGENRSVPFLMLN